MCSMQPGQRLPQTLLHTLSLCLAFVDVITLTEPEPTSHAQLQMIRGPYAISARLISA